MNQGVPIYFPYMFPYFFPSTCEFPHMKPILKPYSPILSHMNHRLIIWKPPLTWHKKQPMSWKSSQCFGVTVAIMQSPADTFRNMAHSSTKFFLVLIKPVQLAVPRKNLTPQGLAVWVQMRSGFVLFVASLGKSGGARWAIYLVSWNPWRHFLSEVLGSQEKKVANRSREEVTHCGLPIKARQQKVAIIGVYDASTLRACCSLPCCNPRLQHAASHRTVRHAGLSAFLTHRAFEPT